MINSLISQAFWGMEGNIHYFSYIDVQFINLYSIINILLNILMPLIQPINQKLMNLAKCISPNI